MITIKNIYADVVWESQKETIKEAVEDAITAGVDLSRVNLRDADLRRADLVGDFKWADLSHADLRWSDLSRAVLSGAGLSGVKLTGAIGLPTIPVVEKINAKILAALEAGGGCPDMRIFHNGWAGTWDAGTWATPSRAGWAIHLAGEAGKILESRVGTIAAAELIYKASRPGKQIPNFWANDEDALDDIRKCAADEVQG